MNSEEVHFKIERFLRGQMDPKEQINFETQVSEDTNLKNEIELHKIAEKAILTHRLSEISKISLQNKVKDAHSNSANVLLIGALLLTLSGALIFWNKGNFNESKNTIQIYPNQDSSSSIKPLINTSKTDVKTEPSKKLPIKPKKQPQTNEKINIGNAVNKPVETVENKATNELPATKTIEKTNSGQYLTTISDQPHSGTDLKTSIVRQGKCDQSKLSAQINTLPTCEGENHGQILITDIKGGIGKYQIKISASDKVFEGLTNLPSGRYDIAISDENHCIGHFKNILVNEKPCGIDYQFNPLLDEHWQSPISNSSYSISIISQSGDILISKLINANESWNWDGKSDSGIELSGVFVYLLKYDNNITKKGTITILR